MHGISWEGGLPHTGVPEIVQPPSQLIPFIDQINVDLTPIVLLQAQYLMSLSAVTNDSLEE
jgi:hypothetical protein